MPRHARLDVPLPWHQRLFSSLTLISPLFYTSHIRASAKENKGMTIDSLFGHVGCAVDLEKAAGARGDFIHANK